MGGLVEGKVAVITGGASGLGRGIAIRLAEEGAAAVVVADMQEEAREGGDPTTTVVQGAGAKAVFVKTDVRVVDDLKNAVARPTSSGASASWSTTPAAASRKDSFPLPKPTSTPSWAAT